MELIAAPVRSLSPDFGVSNTQRTPVKHPKANCTAAGMEDISQYALGTLGWHSEIRLQARLPPLTPQYAGNDAVLEFRTR